MGIATAFSLFATITNATMAIIEPAPTQTNKNTNPTGNVGINHVQHLIFQIVDGTGSGLSALSMFASAALFGMTFWKRRASIRPLVLLLVSIGAVAGCFCFAIVMSLVIAVYPFDNVTKTLIGTAATSTANMIVR